MPTRQISRPNTMGFSIVFAVVVATLLMIGMIAPAQTFHRSSIDLPKTYSASGMPAAERANALMVVVARDGTIFFSVEKIRPNSLAEKIRERLKLNVEKKVYIKADARVPYGALAEVLNGVRDAGIQNVAFVVEPRKR